MAVVGTTWAACDDAEAMLRRATACGVPAATLADAFVDLERVLGTDLLTRGGGSLTKPIDALDDAIAGVISHAVAVLDARSWYVATRAEEAVRGEALRRTAEIVRAHIPWIAILEREQRGPR